jgi:hypothetical protein
VRPEWQVYNSMLTDSISEAIQRYVNKVCNLPSSNLSFPGCLPVSLERINLPVIFGESRDSFREYVLSFKVDGIRHFLVFLKVEQVNYCVLVDRKFKLVQIEVTCYDELFDGTVLDVELVTGCQGTSILIFDTLAIHGIPVVDECYPVRLELGNRLLFNHLHLTSDCEVVPESGGYPSAYPKVTLRLGSYDKNVYLLKVKQIYHHTAIRFLAAGTSEYGTDGFIWTSTNDPYSCFCSNELACLKWKPRGLITVDFWKAVSGSLTGTRSCSDVPKQFRQTQGNCDLFSIHNNQLVFISQVEDTTGTGEGIFECHWDGQWQVGHQREDKSKPNAISTVLRTLRNIQENIGVVDLHYKTYYGNCLAST